MPTARARGRSSKAPSRAGTLQDDEAFFTGKSNKVDVKELPFAVDAAGRWTAGRSASTSTARRATAGPAAATGWWSSADYRQPPSFHIDRLRQADVGHFFDVMTNGFGAMPDYRAQISPRDRWDIVAYIRALQLSQHAAAADVPGGDPAKVPPPAGGAEAGGEKAPEKH